MSIIQAKCENCGGIISIDSSKKSAICPFCNTPFVIQDDINNYNITNNVNVGSGATVNIYGNHNNDFEIEAGVLKKYKGSSTDVVIPNNVIEIGAQAFSGTGVKSVTIPDGVKSIGKSAFWNCTSLTNITIPNSVTSINYGTFFNCISLTSIKIPDSITSIGEQAFQQSSLNTVIIPDGVRTIDRHAFADCKLLANVTIGNSVTSIGEMAFSKCPALATVTIGKSVVSIGKYAFSYCNSLKSITIPNSVTSVDMGAFMSCSSLASVTIGNSVTSIGESVFEGCSSLTNITIPNGVNSIGYYAFGGCTSLTSVMIPDSVTMIDEQAFADCPFTPKAKASNSSNKKSSCYVATAVYGSYDCPQVWTLRRYRDYRLDATWYGRLFIMLYYAISPTLVKWFGHTQWFKKMWKGKLDRMVERLQAEGYEDTPYNDKY